MSKISARAYVELRNGGFVNTKDIVCVQPDVLLVHMRSGCVLGLKDQREVRHAVRALVFHYAPEPAIA